MMKKYFEKSKKMKIEKIKISRKKIYNRVSFENIKKSI